MTKEEYFRHHKEFCKEMEALTKAKNHDYTGNSRNPFANFKICEDTGITTVEQGFLVRMSDKMSRLTSFAKQGTFLVENESAQDTLIDLANYCILLSGYMKSKETHLDKYVEKLRVGDQVDKRGKKVKINQ